MSELNTPRQVTPDDAQEKILHQFFESILPDTMADDLLVRSTATAMSQKLKASRDNGRFGWHTDKVENDQLHADLYQRCACQNLTPDDLVDIINFAAMMRLRLMIYGDRA